MNRMETLPADERVIPVDGKHFVGIGKMIVNNLNSEWNIPHLHFIVSKTPDGTYEATGIELILDASGNTIEDAIEDLSSLTMRYITEVMSSKGCGYGEFIEKAESCVMEGYWQAYRKIEFTLAMKRKDISHELANEPPQGRALRYLRRCIGLSGGSFCKEII